MSPIISRGGQSIAESSWSPLVLTMQAALSRLTAFWAERGCLTVQPMNTEVGAGTLNPATALRVLGPEQWRVAYVEPSVRPDDARYGQNPNRIQTHTQFQVILKPEPGNAQELYLDSLTALGVDVAAHDVRFVEDNWASPALGAWGLGWEVWLDGLEITQFTYFQQAGGVSLDPVSVEITYGMERILMALQGVRHFKDIAYAPGISYGEVFGQAEYEMSRYYLDDADVLANRALLEAYAGEARRMVDAGLPVPAHTLVLKMSHAFNVLDARGSVSTADRASEFARMRALSHDVATLWISTREKAGFPLGISSPPIPKPLPAEESVHSSAAGPEQFALEIGIEEMPPAEAEAARQYLQAELTARLTASRLGHGHVTTFATPRRLVAIVEDVAARERDETRTVRGPRTSVAFDADGRPTKAAEGFARANAIDLADATRIEVSGVEYLAVEREEPGRAAADALADLVAEVTRGLRSSRNMHWNDPELSFTRPIRWILAILGDHVVPARVSNLTATRTTRVLRTAAAPLVEVARASQLLDTLNLHGVLVDQDTRRALIVAQALQLAASVSGHVDVEHEGALIDQITYLVEQPTGVLGAFDSSYLDLPEAVLTTVMRKHQRYLPVRGADGRLVAHFVAVANGAIDCDVVRAGNEAVLRARFEDAAFFYRADLATPIEDLRSALTRLTFTDRLGSMRERADRIAALASRLAADLPLESQDQAVLSRAAHLVKFDLASQMVTELTSLAGTMAQQYALSAGESPEVAQAVLDAELPRTQGDDLPATAAGAVLALADRLDALVGLAATVGLPTGSSDPFTIRRAALGVLALARDADVLRGLSLEAALRTAADLQPVDVTEDVLDAVSVFLARRLEQQLLDEGQSIDQVRAVIQHADQPQLVDQLLGQLASLVHEPGFARLVAAVDRARRIVPAGAEASYDPGTLREASEVALHREFEQARRSVPQRADLASFIVATTALSSAIEAFFEDVLVMADDQAVRSARLGLLASIAVWSQAQITWSELRVAAPVGS